MVSGLLGAADRDSNGEVALDEAYRYAYEQTVRTTSRTRGGTQHPAFRYDLRGQGSVVLTRPEAYAEQRANVQLPEGYGVLLFRGGAEGPVVAEVSERSPQRSLSLRPGRYFVRARAESVLYEGQLSAAAGSTVAADVAQLQRIEYARLVRKGHGTLPWSQSVELGARVRSSLDNAQTPCIGAFVGYGFEAEHLGASARLSACTSGFDNPHVSAQTRAYDLDLRLHHAWDLGSLALELGVGGGLSLFTQSFETRGLAPFRKTLAPFVAVCASAAWELGWQGTYVVLDLAAETHFMRLRRDAVSPSEHTAQFALRSALGLGRRF